MSEADWTEALTAGTRAEAVVFAAGLNGSHAPPAPAKDFFDRGNVEPVRRIVQAARAAGCRQVVVCGSYFVSIARAHPELRLTEQHPYIESRRAQSDVALEAAGPGFDVAVLELPYVLGRTEGRTAALAALAPWLRSRRPLFAPPGGTAVVTVDQVAQAVCEAVQRNVTGRFPMAEANLTWAELFARLAQATGRTSVRVHTLPPRLLSAVLGLAALRYRATKREPGLNPSHMTTLLTHEAYLDPDLCRTELGVTPGGLEQALRDTVS
jgi:nucleoside-diphosphate-sugar epimerase